MRNYEFELYLFPKYHIALYVFSPNIVGVRYVFNSYEVFCEKELKRNRKFPKAVATVLYLSHGFALN